MENLQFKLRELTNESWKLAREALDEKEPKAYHALLRVTEVLNDVIQDEDSQERTGTTTEQAKSIPIFVQHHGERFEAAFHPKRVYRYGHSDCVLFEDRFRTPSAAARSITGYNVNGWRFWRYRRSDGSTGIIDQLR